MKYPNVYTLFRERVEHYGARAPAAVGDGPARDVFYFRRDGQWKGISWERFGAETREFGAALLASGLTRGASVCILMGNVPEWVVADIGTIGAGGIGVGLYPTSSPKSKPLLRWTRRPLMDARVSRATAIFCTGVAKPAQGLSRS